MSTLPLLFYWTVDNQPNDQDSQYFDCLWVHNTNCNITDIIISAKCYHLQLQQIYIPDISQYTWKKLGRKRILNVCAIIDSKRYVRYHCSKSV